MIAVMMTIAGVVLLRPQPAKVYEDWDFLRHPATHLDDLDYKRSSRLFDASSQALERGDGSACQTWVNELIEIYVETWPDFASYATVPKWRQRWIDVFALTTYKKFASCAISDPPRKVWSDYIRNLEPVEGEIPFFCGRITESTLPPDVEASLRLLIQLAFKKDEFPAAWTLFNGSVPRSNTVNLNADVAYYIIQRFKFVESEKEPELLIGTMSGFFDDRFGGPDTAFTPERRAEIEAAARRGDAAAILSTTAPCKPYRAKTKQAD